MATWKYLRIALCVSPIPQPITAKVISYGSIFLTLTSSMARACPAVIEFTFKAKPDGATHGRHGVPPPGELHHLRAIPPEGETPCAVLRHYRLFNLFPPEWIRVASGLFQNFATALLKRANPQTRIAVLP
jgi:hypothetical protein